MPAIAERYRLEQRIGAGGMAEVWVARDERLGRRVAVKIISEALAAHEDWRARFAAEARAAAGLSHPHVVSVYDVGETADGLPFLVLQLVDGPSLRVALDAGATIDGTRLARELLAAVGHVHAHGLLHRDLKPANVLLDAGGAAHLTDFGIARSATASDLTQTGLVIGTLRYIAPEVARGASATIASDLYALGVLLDEAAPEDPALDALVTALTAPDPADRPRSAEAAALLIGRPARDAAPTAIQPARPQPRPVQPPRPARRADSWLAAHGVRPVHVAFSALLALAVTLVLVLAAGPSGDGGGDPGTTATPSGPRPAASGAPLDDQLRSLERQVSALR